MLQEMTYIRQELLPRLRELKQNQEKKAQRQLDQWAGKPGMCTLRLTLLDESVPELKKLPVYNLEEIHYDIEKMFVAGLRGALATAFAKGDAVPSMRANVGCGCVNTLLGGVKQNFYPDKMPWLLERIDPEKLSELTKADITESDEFKFGMDCMRFMKQELEGTGIEVYPIDIQGPVDMAHLWLGNDFFYDVYDEPELVHHVLELAVECDDYAFKKCLEIIKPGAYLAHYNSIVLPADRPIKISEDTSTLLCKEHIEEYMLPYTKELFERMGGGYIHYCGDNRHLLKTAVEFGSNTIGLNFGNPERHDFTKVVPDLIANNNKSYISMSTLPRLTEDMVRAAYSEDGSFHISFNAWCKADEQDALLDKRDELVCKIMKG